MINLKAIFKQIYFLMIISEIIILIATGLIYFLKANRVTEKVLDQKRVLNIISRDSHIEYIAKKISLNCSISQVSNLSNLLICFTNSSY